MRFVGAGFDVLPRALGGIGAVDLFHHTQYRRVPVRGAREVATLHDLCFLDDDRYVEVQGTAEGVAFPRDQLNAMLDIADVGIAELLRLQREAIGDGLDEILPQR